MSFFTELKRRNVFKAGIAYVLVAWILLQAADFVLQVIAAPDWVLQALTLVAAIGLPVVLVFAWVFEMTPQGLKLESEIERSQSVTHETGKKLNLVIMLVLVAAVVILAMRLYQRPSETAVAAPESRELPHSIAVLPFEDYSEAGDQGHFSKGIAEEILNLLAKTDALRVAARTSSFAFAGSDMDIRDIGQKLDVGTVLEGSVRKSGPTIRITAQLINVTNGYHIWSETYDRDYQDIFRIQDEIATAIMASLRVHLLGEEQRLLQSERSADLDAYSAYLIGKERMALRTREDIEAARGQFEKALALDPEFAPAHVQLAHSWLLSEQERFGGEDVDRNRVDEIIAPHLEKALELAPDLPEAIAVKGYHDLRRYRFEEAEQAFDRAITLNPNYALAYAWRAETLYEQQRFLDMLADKEKAYALDPMSLEISADLAAEYRNFWRPLEAERVIERMFELHPDHPLAYRAAIHNLANHGRYGESLLMLEKALAANPDNSRFQEYLGWAFSQIGLYDEALELGDEEVAFFVAMSNGDFETAEMLVRESLQETGPRERHWHSHARWLYSAAGGEHSQALFMQHLDRGLAAMEEQHIPWRERCLPYLIQDLRLAGRESDTVGMMEKCRVEIEERFRAQYLCPCSWYFVVLYTILDGRIDEAVERADRWLTHGDSTNLLHVDPIFKLLSDRPEYPGFLARNAAQIERQRNIYLAGKGGGAEEVAHVN